MTKAFTSAQFADMIKSQRETIECAIENLQAALDEANSETTPAAMIARLGLTVALVTKAELI